MDSETYIYKPARQRSRQWRWYRYESLMPECTRRRVVSVSPARRVAYTALALTLAAGIFAFVGWRRAPPALTFLVIGDWGAPVERPELVGTQRLVARAMGVLAASGGVLSDARFVVNLGDAFYKYGVTDVHDPRLGRVFNVSFGVAPALARLPWYSVMGNHDCRGNASALLLAGQPDARAPAPQYQLPARYWSKSVALGRRGSLALNPLATGPQRLRLTFLDTCSLVCHKSEAEEEVGPLQEADAVLRTPKHTAERWRAMQAALEKWPPTDTLPLGFNGTVGRTSECRRLPPENRAPFVEQLKWLRAALARARAASAKDWSIVVGHSPVWSVAAGHGDYPQLVRRLDPLLRRPAAQLYLAGDEHNMQHIERNGMHYVVAGAGGGLDLHPLQEAAAAGRGAPRAAPTAGVASSPPPPRHRAGGTVHYAQSVHGFVSVRLWASVLELSYWRVVPMGAAGATAAGGGDAAADEAATVATFTADYDGRGGTTYAVQLAHRARIPRS